MERTKTRTRAALGFAYRTAKSTTRAVAVALALFANFSLAPAIAQTANFVGGTPLIVRSDRGGWISDRVAEIQKISAMGQRVEIRGACMSSCTMYLSLPNVCVAASARLRFHGPSANGRPLSAQDFEYWSQVMAANYREPLRSWFMNEARYTITGYFEISGTQLIQMGYPPC